MPVPALPTSVTSLMSSLSSRSSAKCCSLLRGRMPHTPSFGACLSGRTPALAADRSGRARCAGGLVRSRRRNWFGGGRRAGCLQLAARVELVDRRATTSSSRARSELVDLDPLDVVVLGVQAERVRADAQVDVLGDEDGRDASVGSRTSSATARMRLSSIEWPSASRRGERFSATSHAQITPPVRAIGTPSRSLPCSRELVEVARPGARCGRAPRDRA